MQNRIVQKEKTSISNIIYIVGNIKAEEDLIINGKVKGNVEIKNHSFFLGPSGRLQGNIHGLNVRIRGQMKGEIKATGRVEITQEAKFSGKIKCKSISVEKGAYFDAYVDLGRKSPEKGSLEETSTVAQGSESS
jgi:cytoskeletal protein CcmA (bactofilin family)